jgi:hypothetical protein
VRVHHTLDSPCLSSNTICRVCVWQILQAAVGIYVPVIPPPGSRTADSATDGSPLQLHVYQAVHCLCFLDVNMERVVTIWKPKDSAIIVDALHRILQRIFISCERVV